jgi:hypothetical protein
MWLDGKNISTAALTKTVVCCRLQRQLMAVAVFKVE